jgi:hypothetical protein
MTYAEQLLDKRWINKRRKIIHRDHFRCTACNNYAILADCQMAISDAFYNPNNIWRRVGHRIPDREIILLHFHKELVPRLQHPMMYYYQPLENHHTRLVGVRWLLDKEWTTYVEYHKSKADEYLAMNPPKIHDEIANALREIYELPFPSVSYSLNDYRLFDWCHVAELNVHHTYYQLAKFAWDYPDEALKTYCQICHMQLHAYEKIPLLNELGIEVGSLTPCVRCAGAGEFPEYRHIEEGICFRCRGAKYEELTNH